MCGCREIELEQQLREAKKSSLDEEMRAIERQKLDAEWSRAMESQQQVVVQLQEQLEAKVPKG